MLQLSPFSASAPAIVPIGTAPVSGSGEFSLVLAGAVEDAGAPLGGLIALESPVLRQSIAAPGNDVPAAIDSLIDKAPAALIDLAGAIELVSEFGREGDADQDSDQTDSLPSVDLSSPAPIGVFPSIAPMPVEVQPIMGGGAVKASAGAPSQPAARSALPPPAPLDTSAVGGAIDNSAAGVPRAAASIVSTPAREPGAGSEGRDGVASSPVALTPGALPATSRSGFPILAQQAVGIAETAKGPVVTASAAVAVPVRASLAVVGRAEPAADGGVVPIALPVTPLPPVIGLPVPAARAFAAAIAAATIPSARALQDDEPLDAVPTGASSIDIPVHRAGLADRLSSAIDTRSEDWTRALVERIDAVRDVANARDTRITLLPDALGKIQVALRQEGNAVHVAFTADVLATRTLLAEAQPRLAELAEARGLRLAESSISAGSNGSGSAPGPGNGFGQTADHRRATTSPRAENRDASTTTNPVRDTTDPDNRIA
jgi:flagellar hook-length control protein FliK